jgi:hypothetical protein
MKYRGRTGNGYYKEYFGAPKWFAKGFKCTGNGSLLNVAGSGHYIGNGMDGKTKTWYSGSFIKDSYYDYFQKEVEAADFIIHFEVTL